MTQKEVGKRSSVDHFFSFSPTSTTIFEFISRSPIFQFGVPLDAAFKCQVPARCYTRCANFLGGGGNYACGCVWAVPEFCPTFHAKFQKLTFGNFNGFHPSSHELSQKFPVAHFYGVVFSLPFPCLKTQPLPRACQIPQMIKNLNGVQATILLPPVVCFPTTNSCQNEFGILMARLKPFFLPPNPPRKCFCGSLCAFFPRK